jgi:hypothetical protein
VFRRLLHAVTRTVHRLRDDVGQTTAEYALVILGAAALATLLITWATKSHAVGKLFDEVIGKVLQ